MLKHEKKKFNISKRYTIQECKYYGGDKLIFEGEYKDGKKSKGKEYNYYYDYQLIFEGEFKDGKNIKEKKLNLIFMIFLYQNLKVNIKME